MFSRIDYTYIVMIFCVSKQSITMYELRVCVCVKIQSNDDDDDIFFNVLV